jgi:hypothetical protein
MAKATFYQPYQPDYESDGTPNDPTEKARRQAIIQQRVLQHQAAQRGGQSYGQPQGQLTPEQVQANAQQAAEARGQQGHAPAQQAAPSYQHPMAAAHFGAQSKMIGQTNAAIAHEMDSRREQAAAEADRQHEYQMEMLKQQGRQQQQSYQPQQESESQLDQIRKARNRSLMAKAGLGGHTVRGDENGVTVTPHPYGNNPFAQALLGD